MTYTIVPLFGFDWPRFAISDETGRRFGRFVSKEEADTYLARVNRPPAPPGPNPELRAMADEAAAMLVLRSFDWKRKKNPAPEPIMPRYDDNEEIPF